jgi:hypothetical protein
MMEEGGGQVRTTGGVEAVPEGVEVAGLAASPADLRLWDFDLRLEHGRASDQ